MANPLYQAISGGSNMGDAMQQLRANPMQMLKNAGYQVPDEIAGDPRAVVMHLIQSGQVGGAVMQRIQPFLNGMMGR